MFIEKYLDFKNYIFIVLFEDFDYLKSNLELSCNDTL